MAEQGQPSLPDDAVRRKRIGVRLRVLALMGLAMTLFLLALLFIVYHQLAESVTAASARSIVVSLVPLVLLILIICGALFFSLTNRLLLGPIKKIRDSAQAISHGQLDTTITATGNDEIGDLAQSVGQMANVLKRDIQSLKEVDELKSEFIAISSHMLRTPLATIEGGLDVLKSAALDTESKKILEMVHASANNLIAFSEDMLTIANMEAKRESTAQLQPAVLRDILVPVIEDFEAVAKKRGLTFTTALEDHDAKVPANARLLRLAFRNLLDNACKFTHSGGQVEIRARQENGQAIVTVKDTGIGIASDEIPNLFTKFHRGTGTLAYNYEGTGVGLYIAKLILDQHGAHIAIDSAPDKGTTAAVSLPLAPSVHGTTE